jgi:YVTN family beta-propeller protein
MAYVATTDGNVIPVDMTAGRAERPIPADPKPGAIAITPDGRTAYVADAFTATVTPVDLATGVTGAPISVADDGAVSSIAISPSGATAYVSVVPEAQASGLVVPIALATGTVEPAIPVGPVPVAIAITPDGSTAYVVNSGDGTVTPIDLTTEAAYPPLQVGGNPVAIGITPDGDTAYVMDGVDAGAVIPIALSPTGGRDVVGGAIATVSGVAQAIAISPDGRTAVVVGGTGANLISLPGGAQVGTTISGNFTTAVISPDGASALLGFTDGDGGSQGVLQVGLSAGTSGTPIILAGEPVAIAIRP